MFLWLRRDNYWSSLCCRLFGVPCAVCKEGIAPDQYVRKQDSGIFHIGCLKCQQCQKEASTGDQLHVVGESFYLCKKDFEQMKNAPKKIPKDGIYQVLYSYFFYKPTPCWIKIRSFMITHFNNMHPNVWW